MDRDARSLAYVILTDLLFGFAALTTLLRVYVRAIAARIFGLDDALMVLSMILGAGVMANGHLIARDQNALADAPPFPPPIRHIVNLTREIFVQGFIYVWQIGLIKLALLAFYYRLAPHSRSRHLIYGTAIVTVLLTIACTFAAIFQCKPVSRSWNPTPGGPDCRIGSLRIQLGFGACNVATDVMVLLLPVNLVIRLRASWRRRAGLLAIFLLGAVGTVATIVRLWKVTEVLHLILDSPRNDTFKQAEDIGISSSAEAYLATICANAPSLAALWRIWRTHVKKSKQLSSSHPGSNRYHFELSDREAAAALGKPDSVKQPTVHVLAK